LEPPLPNSPNTSQVQWTHTGIVSERRPIPLYYELHDLLDEGSESQGGFKELDSDIASAVKEGLKNTILLWMSPRFTTFGIGSQC
jgi:hypothetical protein